MKTKWNSTVWKYQQKDLLRTRNTVELLGIWEQIHYPNFKIIEFEGFRNSHYTDEDLDSACLFKETRGWRYE